MYQVLVMNLPEESSNQKAPVGLCPAGRIAALSLIETPTTLDLKLPASRNSSVIVDASRFRGDILPASAVPPTASTRVSSVQYHGRPLSWSIHSLPAIPCIEGTDPV